MGRMPRQRGGERVWANTADGQRLRDDSGLGDTEAFEAFVGVASE